VINKNKYYSNSTPVLNFTWLRWYLFNKYDFEWKQAWEQLNSLT